MEDGCEASLAKTGMSYRTSVIPFPAVLLGDLSIQDLRKMKNVVIPEGTEEIGNRWFYDSDVESVIVPASVAEIGAYAFCECGHLRRVTFVPGSMLKKIHVGSFCESGIERIVIPKEVEEIENSAF